jgi:hypothetical protein
LPTRNPSAVRPPRSGQNPVKRLQLCLVSADQYLLEVVLVRGKGLYLAICLFAGFSAADPLQALCQQSDHQEVEPKLISGSDFVASHPIRFAVFHHDDLAFSLSRFTFFVTTIADIETTWRVIGRGGREVNPVLGQSRVQQALIAGTSVAAMTVLTEKLYQNGHRKLATIVNLVTAGGHGIAAGHNARIP